MRTNWNLVLQHARPIAREYDVPPTVRQLFYRLVADGTLRNTEPQYKTLSDRTAKARRSGTFPSLSDGTRHIAETYWYEDANAARQELSENFRLDRRQGQPTQVWVVVEKATLEYQARYATDEFGTPVVALRGYASQTIIDTMAQRMGDDSTHIVYVGDFDPSGEDIERDLMNRLGGLQLATIERIAVTPQQVEDLSLPEMYGKASDSRAAGFTAKHGKLVQVEAEAIPPDVLTQLIHDTVEGYTDRDILGEVIEREERERELL